MYTDPLSSPQLDRVGSAITDIFLQKRKPGTERLINLSKPHSKLATLGFHQIQVPCLAPGCVPWELIGGSSKHENIAVRGCTGPQLCRETSTQRKSILSGLYLCHRYACCAVLRPQTTGSTLSRAGKCWGYRQPAPVLPHPHSGGIL